MGEEGDRAQNLSRPTLLLICVEVGCRVPNRGFVVSLVHGIVSFA